MDEINFRCPDVVAQRFWLLCAELGETPGSLLRSFIVDEVKAVDPAFFKELEAETGLDEARVRKGNPPKDRALADRFARPGG